MPTYRVRHGKHTLWEGDKESGEHVEVGPGDEFSVAKLSAALHPFVDKVASTGVKKTKKRTAVKDEENETDASSDDNTSDE